MKKYFSAKNRPMHLGPYPLETLERTDARPDYSDVPPMHEVVFDAPERPQSLTNSMPAFIALLTQLRDGMVAPKKAPFPHDDAAACANNLKSWIYHEGLSMAGVCAIPDEALLDTPLRGGGKAVRAALSASRELKTGASKNKMFARDDRVTSTLYGGGQVGGSEAGSPAGEAPAGPKPQAGPGPGGPGGLGGAPTMVLDTDLKALGHSHALVILVEYTRDIRPGEPGYDYIQGTQEQRATSLALEGAVLVAGYVRTLGFNARAHSPVDSELDLNVLTVAAGLGAVRQGPDGAYVEAPYLGRRYGVAAVSTDLPLKPDRPWTGRKTRASHGLRRYFGFGGTKPALKIGTSAARPLHLGKFPMESIKRVDKPTTIVDEPNIPRIPKRHDMFIRAAHGDLGEKPAKAMEGLALMLKEPYNHMTMRIIGGCVPLQYGQEAATPAPGTGDPVANADAIKALCTYTGADIVAICEAKPHMWYSHDTDGSEIVPYHKNAILVLADQGYETMEGSSGDDWITGSQGTKGYRRASLYTGMVAEHIRRLGYSARTHTVIDQDVLHIPMMLEAGVGELCRIGEIVLNPFMGPRFKSAVITTDMPLAYDRPIDFGMQDFCEKCNKCARECPPQAIPWGDKIMFNGYESWKQDPVKCANYRITNPGGCGCGRCMKTCPWNREGVLIDKAFTFAAIRMPFLRRWLARLDDRLDRGIRNTVKQWWFEVGWVGGEVIKPDRINARDLRKDHDMDSDRQKIAVFPADLAPPPDAQGTVPVKDVMKTGMDRYKTAEHPRAYADRLKAQGRDPTPVKINLIDAGRRRRES